MKLNRYLKKLAILGSIGMIFGSCANVDENEEVLSQIAVVQRCREISLMENNFSQSQAYSGLSFDYDNIGRLLSINALGFRDNLIRNQYIDENYFRAFEPATSVRTSNGGRVTFSPVWHFTLSSFKVAQVYRTWKNTDQSFKDSLVYSFQYDNLNRLKQLAFVKFISPIEGSQLVPERIESKMDFEYNAEGALIGYTVDIFEPAKNLRSVEKATITPSIYDYNFHRAYARFILVPYVEKFLALNGPLLNLGNKLPGKILVQNMVTGTFIRSVDLEPDFIIESYATLNNNSIYIEASCQ